MKNKRTGDNTELESLRNEIDKCDKEIVRLLNRRFELVRKVGQYKAAHNLPVRDEAREIEIISERECQAASDFPIAEIFKSILEQSCRVQMKIKDDAESNS